MELENLLWKQMSQEMKLTTTQELAYSYMVKGLNVCLTGSAGTGKSECIKRFRKLYQGRRVIATTSTTGISAILIGGTTLHSYLGIGLGTGSIGALTSKILKKSYLRKRWKQLQTLIIDEISMLSPDLFDKLEAIARAVRNDSRPFGGIQLVVSGDYSQLPVVGEDNFCFEAETWEKCIDKTVYLKENVRQTDLEFQNCLSEVRMGKLSRESKEFLKSCCGKKLTNDYGIKPTKIFATNAEVDEMNDEELDTLGEDEREFKQYDMESELYIFVPDKEYVLGKHRKSCPAPEVLQLCEGAQVMLVWNLDMDSQLVNGSRGVVTGFVEDLPLVKFLDGQERVIDYNTWDIEEGDQKIMSITQIPLKIAYSITAHKSQGATLDYAIVDMSNIFTYGQAYVALSRVRTKSGLSIKGLDFKKIKTHPKAIEYYKGLEKVESQPSIS
jgi:ATP-dependent DNA helicase PIF1